MRILGIDPGLKATGYGLIQFPEMIAIDWGCIKPPSELDIADRLWIIEEAVSSLIKQYNPSHIAIESQFVSINPMSALKLGMVRGVLMSCGRRHGLQVSEFAPRQVKKAVTGVGQAEKSQIQFMISKQLKIECDQLPLDASDALAVAFCAGQNTWKKNYDPISRR